MTKYGRTSQPRRIAVRGNHELADFFGLLGARFAYDRAKADAATPRPVENPAAPRRTLAQSSRRRRRLVSLSAALVCLLMILVGTLPSLLRSAELPADVLGTWRTTADGYAHRGFTFTPTTLVLNAGLDGKQVSTHPITRVRVTPHGGETTYAIEYLVDNARYVLSLRYSSGPPSVIHLSHQRELAWSRDSTGEERRRIR
jgi:hypothetical protein